MTSDPDPGQRILTLHRDIKGDRNRHPPRNGPRLALGTGTQSCWSSSSSQKPLLQRNGVALRPWLTLSRPQGPWCDRDKLATWGSGQTARAQGANQALPPASPPLTGTLAGSWAGQETRNHMPLDAPPMIPHSYQLCVRGVQGRVCGPVSETRSLRCRQRAGGGAGAGGASPSGPPALQGARAPVPSRGRRFLSGRDAIPGHF